MVCEMAVGLFFCLIGPVVAGVTGLLWSIFENEVCAECFGSWSGHWCDRVDSHLCRHRVMR